MSFQVREDLVYCAEQFFAAGGIEYGQDLFTCSGCTLKDIEFFCEITYGFEETVYIGQKHHYQTVGDCTFKKKSGSKVDYQTYGEPFEKIDQRTKNRIDDHLTEVCLIDQAVD